MKICIVSHEYEPFYGGGIATYHNTAARRLAEAGHEVHVVTNAATYGRQEPHFAQPRWQDGNLTVHRLPYFDDNGKPPTRFHFFDTLPDTYRDERANWAGHISNQAAYTFANYFETLHAGVDFDVLESPEYFGEAFYVLRRRLSGEGHKWPAVCVHGHMSTRIALSLNGDVRGLGSYARRQMMAREEYCIREADGLVTPSHAMMHQYKAQFQQALPLVREVIPHFLDIPAEFGALPDELTEGHYMAVVGRIERRKGTDIALRAFSQLADEYPELKLALVGADSWAGAESVDEMISTCLSVRHRDRLVTTGRVSRETALRIVRGAALFIHPSPWDNYPFAVMEAMALGTVCVVSDHGGQAEMVENGRSGVVFQAGSADALADAARGILRSSRYSSQLRRGAVRRITDITSTNLLIDKTIDHYQRAIQFARKRCSATMRPDKARVGRASHKRPKSDNIPGCGLVLVDGLDADEHELAITRENVLGELDLAIGWRVEALSRSPSHQPPLDAAGPHLNSPPWIEMSEAVLVYVLAGVRFDAGAIKSLVTQVLQSRTICGSFAWLRPTAAPVFPYRPDLTWQDLLRTGQPLPPAFAVAAVHLKSCVSLIGLKGQAERVGALMAAAAAQQNLVFQHTGRVCGDFSHELPAIERDGQNRLMGYLDMLEVFANVNSLSRQV